jgi:hypothetical protein
LAVIAAKELFPNFFHRMHFEGLIGEISFGLGALLAVLGTGIWIASSLFGLGAPLGRVLERVIEVRIGHPYRFALAKAEGLPEIYDFYKEYFKADAPRLSLMQSWFAKCESVFVLQYDVKNTSKPRLVGSFKLLPLSKRGVRDVELGVVSGSTFGPEHICSYFSRASAYYVGDLCAAGLGARSVIVKELEDTCAELIHKGRPIYARPFTADGRRVMVNNGFRQVSNGSFVLTMRELCRLDPSTQNHGSAFMRRLGDSLQRRRPNRQ